MGKGKDERDCGHIKFHDFSCLVILVKSWPICTNSFLSFNLTREQIHETWPQIMGTWEKMNKLWEFFHVTDL